jgi:hypothetical protein
LKKANGATNPEKFQNFIKKEKLDNIRGAYLDLIIIGLIIFGALILLFATRFLSKSFKIITKILLIIVLLFAILTIITYNDLSNLKKGFYEKNNMFVLYGNNTVYAAVNLKPIKNLSFTLDSFDYFSAEEMTKIEDYVNQKNYSGLQGYNTDNKTVNIFIVTPELIDNPYNLKLTAELDEKEIISMIMSDNPYSIPAKKLVKEYNSTEENLIIALQENYGNDEKIKGYLFAALLMNYYQSTGSNIINDVKSGDMQIIPEMTSVKIMRQLPMI